MAEVDDQIAAVARLNAIPGLAIALFQRGKAPRIRGYGLASDSTPVTPQTQFMVASLTKAFTAAGVLQLAEAGKVDLDAPAKRYLPALRLGNAAQTDAVTIRFLLNQTSGLDDRGFPEMRMAPSHTLQERVARLSEARFFAHPGAKFAYFNPNYAVLARIVEVASGEDFDAYLSAHIFKPLGMTDTFSAVTSAEIYRRAHSLAKGHVELFGAAIPWREMDGVLAGSGDVVSSARDMARWLAALANGGELDGVRILSAESVRFMETPPGESPYGMGWFRTQLLGRPALFHDGVLSSFYAEAAILPEDGYGYVVLANVNSIPHALLTFPQLREAILCSLSHTSYRPGMLGVRMAGMGFAVLTLLMAILAGRDLRRTLRRPARKRRFLIRIAGIVVRLTPLAFVLALSWIVEMTSGRVFSYGATITAMMDFAMLFGVSGCIFCVSALLRLVRLIAVASADQGAAGRGSGFPAQRGG